MELEFELELNHEWIYDEKDEEIIGEKNFVVSFVWLLINIRKICPHTDIGNSKDFDDFLNWYCPEEEGEMIYRAAKMSNKIIDEFDTYYKEDEE